MTSVHLAPVLSAVGVAALLGATGATVGLTDRGLLLGAVYGFAAAALLDRALDRRSRTALGPADWVTLARMVLVGGVVGLGAGFPDASTAVLVVLASVALVLDGVDGRVARHTGTASEFGARFDMEVDAFLILVLSVLAAQSVGAWVLVIGAARYAFVAASWFAGWMRRPLPPRHWRKVVAVVQGVALLIVVSGVLPVGMSVAVAAASLVLLLESFGRDVLWLWRRRRQPLHGADVPERSAASTSRTLR